MRKRFRKKTAAFFVLIPVLLTGCAGLVGIKIPQPVRQNNPNSWVMLGKDPAHQFGNEINIIPPLKIVWKKTIKSVVTDHPLAFGNFIIVTSQDAVLNIIDYATGSGLSSGRIGPAIMHAPTIADNTMYTGFNLGKENFLALNLKTAQPLYRKTFPAVSTSPLILNDRIYLGTERGYFYSLEKNSGDVVWKYRAQASIAGSPAFAGKNLFFSDIKGNVYALESAGGELLWKTALHGNAFSYPVISDSLLFLGTTEGLLYALNISTGAIRWKDRFKGSIYGSPSIYGDNLYIGNNDHKVVSIRKRTGKINWEFETGGVVNTVPVPSPDYIYATSWDHYLYVLDRQTGKLVYKHEFNSPIKSSPIIYRDFLILQTANRKLYALANVDFVPPKEGRK